MVTLILLDGEFPLLHAPQRHVPVSQPVKARIAVVSISPR
jgi:hypothetical protein